MHNLFCPICNSKTANIVRTAFPGYVENTNYDIYECVECDSQFIDVSEIDTKIYDILYENHDAYGYERYHKYACEIKSQANPIKYLAEMEGTYNPISAFLEGKERLDILEVGAGYGYLTYSLNAAGHVAVGIDVSASAVDFARKQFGDCFWHGDLKAYPREKKYDLIIATELIEHLYDPTEFIALCFSHLKDNGAVLVTSPNKDYCKGAIWQTDLPPVHSVWLSRKSFKAIATKESLAVRFLDFDYDAKSENRLVIYLLTRINNVPAHRLTTDGQTSGEMANKAIVVLSILAKTIALFWPIRKLSNYCMNIISKEPRVICACFSRSGLQ